MPKTNFSEQYPRLLTFKGSFKDLKPGGFKFQRLFANNYMQWCFNNGDQYSPNEIRIWRHLGGYMEINDYYSCSKALARVICSPELLESFSYKFGDSTYYRFILDINNGLTVRYSITEHNAGHIFANRMHEEGIKEVINTWYDHFNSNYRSVEIKSTCWLIYKVRMLYEAGWINPFE